MGRGLCVCHILRDVAQRRLLPTLQIFLISRTREIRWPLGWRKAICTLVPLLCSSRGQRGQRLVVTDKRPFLCARPPFDLPFERDCFVHSFERCGKHDRNGPARKRVAGRIEPLCVLADALFDFATGYCGVVASVPAAKNVNGCAHDRSLSSPRTLNHPPILTSAAGASRRMGKGLRVCHILRDTASRFLRMRSLATKKGARNRAPSVTQN
jgi:hypothetical protein